MRWGFGELEIRFSFLLRYHNKFVRFVVSIAKNNLSCYTAKRQCKQGTYKCYFISNIEMLTYGKLLDIGREMYEYTL